MTAICIFNSLPFSFFEHPNAQMRILRVNLFNGEHSSRQILKTAFPYLYKSYIREETEYFTIPVEDLTYPRFPELKSL